jgi:PAS domain S-box-containing protein
MSNEKVRLLLDSTAEAIYGVDLQGNCTFVNPSCLRVLGYADQEQLLGRNMDSRIRHPHPKENPMSDKNSRIFREFGDSKGTHSDNEILWRADGTSFPAEYWSYPQIVNGTVIGAVVTFNDISERVQALEQLALQQEQLESLNRSLQKRVNDAVAESRQKDQVLISQSRQAAMGEMIGNIAHQWRQPLNLLAILIGDLQLAQQYRELTDEYMNESVDDINRLIQKMSSTINDFRNFFNPDKERVTFSTINQVRLAVEMVEGAFRNNSISIRFDPAADCTLYGFPNEYSQVLLNLLNNAKDAIVEAGVRAGRIDIAIREENGMGVVSVSDNGCGIPESVQGKIFEPYFSTKESGTGIGLYMSKMIIERNLNGRIDVQAREGGTEFSIAVPLAVETA